MAHSTTLIYLIIFLFLFWERKFSLQLLLPNVSDTEIQLKCYRKLAKDFMNELALGCMSMCKSDVGWPIDAHASPPFFSPRMREYRSWYSSGCVSERFSWMKFLRDINKKSSGGDFWEWDYIHTLVSMLVTSSRVFCSLLARDSFSLLLNCCFSLSRIWIIIT